MAKKLVNWKRSQKKKKAQVSQASIPSWDRFRVELFYPLSCREPVRKKVQL